MTPILIVCCASAGAKASMAAANPAKPTNVCRTAALPGAPASHDLRRSPRREDQALPPRNPRSGSLSAARPRRILDLLDLVERDIDEFIADLLHTPDIDRLHDVARLGIDRHRTARAVPPQPLGGRDQGLAVGLAAGALERLIDGVHAVIAADGEEVRVA